MKALITGASSGIGLDMAKYLATKNYELILVARNKEKLERWRNTLSEQIDYVIKESGWSRKEVKFHMNKIRLVYDFPPDYYVLYRMWELSDVQIDTYARRKDSDRLYAKYNKIESAIDIFKEKKKTKLQKKSSEEKD